MWLTFPQPGGFHARFRSRFDHRRRYSRRRLLSPLGAEGAGRRGGGRVDRGLPVLMHRRQQRRWRRRGGGGSKKTSLGSSASDPVPKTGIAAMVSAFEKKSGDKVSINTKSHNDFQNDDQHLPAGQPGRHVHLVRRLPHALLRRRRAWWRRSTTSGRRSAPATSAPASSRPRPATTARSTSCRTTTTRGPSSTGRAVWQSKGYEVPKTFDDLEDPRREDEEGRPDPDRVRRQGRLAGDGHVRLPQHARSTATSSTST